MYGDPADWALQGTTLQTLLAFVNVQKYPPSLQYLLLTLGAAFLCLAAFESARGKFSEVLRTFGRVPLFFYVLHIALAHLAAGIIALRDGIRHGAAQRRLHESSRSSGASACQSSISRGCSSSPLSIPRAAGSLQ